MIYSINQNHSKLRKTQSVRPKASNPPQPEPALDPINNGKAPAVNDSNNSLYNVIRVGMDIVIKVCTSTILNALYGITTTILYSWFLGVILLFIALMKWFQETILDPYQLASSSDEIISSLHGRFAQSHESAVRTIFATRRAGTTNTWKVIWYSLRDRMCDIFLKLYKGSDKVDGIVTPSDDYTSTMKPVLADSSSRPRRFKGYRHISLVEESDSRPSKLSDIYRR